MRSRVLLVAVAMLLATDAAAQTTAARQVKMANGSTLQDEYDQGTMRSPIPTVVSALPSSPTFTERIYRVTDATVAGQCAAGGASPGFHVLCGWDTDTSSWVALSGGAGAGGGAPIDAQYLLGAADATLPNEVVVDDLAALNLHLGSSIADGAHTAAGAPSGAQYLLGAADAGAPASVVVSDLGELNAHLGSSLADGPHTSDASDLVTGTIAAALVGASHIDSLSEIDAALLSGLGAVLITGAPGASGNLVVWDANGGAVDGGAPTVGVMAQGTGGVHPATATDDILVGTGGGSDCGSAKICLDESTGSVVLSTAGATFNAPAPAATGAFLTLPEAASTGEGHTWSLQAPVDLNGSSVCSIAPDGTIDCAGATGFEAAFGSLGGVDLALDATVNLSPLEVDGTAISVASNAVTISTAGVYEALWAIAVRFQRSDPTPGDECMTIGWWNQTDDVTVPNQRFAQTGNAAKDIDDALSRLDQPIGFTRIRVTTPPKTFILYTDVCAAGTYPTLNRISSPNSYFRIEKIN